MRCRRRPGPGVGVQRARIRAALGAVDNWTHWAQAHGIHAIPAFVFEGRVLGSGAQPHEVLARAARRARESATAEEG
jgi:predicted DsbA family dithiol-disulfide isomerase